MSGSYDFLRVIDAGGVTTITLDRPEALNALTAAMHFELHDAFDRFAADSKQKIAVVRAAGRAFCVGSDLKAQTRVMVPRAQKAERYPPSGYAGLAERFDLDKPVIAVVDGAALGGGFELVLACDLVLATTNARFGLPEPKVGAVALGGGVHRLARQIGLKRAMGLILGGGTIDAETAFALGLITELVSPDKLEAAVTRWTDTLLGHSQLALRAAKEAVMRGLDEPSLSAAITRQDEYPAFARLVASDDVAEGPKAFIERQAPRWTE